MSKVKIQIVCLLQILFWLAPTSAQSQSEHVYLVKIFDCKPAPKCKRVQTGFRVRGLKGIVTALHGVADAGDIRVIGDYGAAKFKGPLRVGKVDVAHDVALLTSAEIEAAPADGLGVAENVNWEEVVTINLIGRPLGLTANLATSLALRRPALKPLRDLLPPDTAVRLLDRRSPDPDEDVVSINGVILPGDSGAPALDSRDRLLAVGNGGLLGGPSGINWAIPWQSVRLVDTASESRLPALRTADPGTFFSFENDRPEMYKVRIIVVDPRGKLVSDAKIITSLGGEVLNATGAYQYEVARAKVPQDGMLTLHASKENAFLKGKANLTLANDPNITVTITLSKDDSAYVRGRVIDESKTGVAGARVSVAGYEAEAVVTKTGGGFVLPAHAADGEQVMLQAEKDGYESVNQYHPAGNEKATILLVRKRP